MDTYSYIVSKCGTYVYRVNNATKEKTVIRELKAVVKTPPLTPVIDADPSARRGRKRPRQKTVEPVKIEKVKKPKPILAKVNIDPTVRRGRGHRPRPNVEPFIKRTNKPKKHRHVNKIKVKKEIKKLPYKGKKYKGVVLTYLTAGYDDLPKLNKTEGWDYICVTDNKIKNKDWTIIDLRQEDKLVVGSKKQASSIMFNAINYLEKEYDILITMDANMFINDDLNKIVNDYKILETKNDVTFLSHPDRDCVYEEIKALLKLSKDTRINTLNALKFLQEEEYPEKLGLFATGVIFMNPKSNILKKYLEKIREDYIKSSSIRDQVTINYSLWKNSKILDPLSYGTLPFKVVVAYTYKHLSTPFIVYPHNKNKKKNLRCRPKKHR